MWLKSVRPFYTSALLVTFLISACEVIPDGRSGIILDPVKFSENPSSPLIINDQPGNVSLVLSTTTLLGISSLDEKNAKEFIGRKSESLIGLIGLTDFVRHERIVEIWQYRSKACIFDLFMYGKSIDKTVQHAEVRGDGIGTSPKQGCFAKLLQGRDKKKHASGSTKTSSL